MTSRNSNHMNTNGRFNNTYTKHKPSYDTHKSDKNHIPYYPINTQENNEIYKKYKEFAEKEFPNLIIGGRLGNYKYYDMDMAVGNALATVKKEFS